MNRTNIAMVCIVALAIGAAPSQAGQVVNFKGTITNVQSSGNVDAIHQYIAVNDTFSGSFEYDPNAVGTPLGTINNVGTRMQYDSAITGVFTLRFTSGASAGYAINGATPGGFSNMTVSDGILGVSTGPIEDNTSAVLSQLPYEFRPGLVQRNLVYRLYDRVEANLVNSASLTDWNANQVFANIDRQINELAFSSRVTSFAQTASFDFTEFAFADASTKAASAQVGGLGVVEASLLGGASGAAAGGVDVAIRTGGSTGELQAIYSNSSTAEFTEDYAGTAGFALLNFPQGASGGGVQLWDVGYTGPVAPSGLTTLSFKYDDSQLTTPESELGIWHFGTYGPGGQREWKWLAGTVDETNNTITVSVDNLSPFALGVQSVPEPSTWALLGMGTLCFLGSCWRRTRRTGLSSE